MLGFLTSLNKINAPPLSLHQKNIAADMQGYKLMASAAKAGKYRMTKNHLMWNLYTLGASRCRQGQEQIYRGHPGNRKMLRLRLRNRV